MTYTPPIGNPGEAMQEAVATLRVRGYAVDEVSSVLSNGATGEFKVTGNLLGLFDGNRLGMFTAEVWESGAVILRAGAFGTIEVGTDGESTDDPFDGL